MCPYVSVICHHPRPVPGPRACADAAVAGIRGLPSSVAHAGLNHAREIIKDLRWVHLSTKYPEMIWNNSISYLYTCYVQQPLLLLLPQEVKLFGPMDSFPNGKTSRPRPLAFLGPIFSRTNHFWASTVYVSSWDSICPMMLVSLAKRVCMCHPREILSPRSIWGTRTVFFTSPFSIRPKTIHVWL